MTTRTASLRLQLIDAVSGPSKNSHTALKNLDSSISRLGKNGMRGARNLVNQLEHLRQKSASVGRFQELRQGLAGTFTEFRAARTRAQELQRALEGVTKPTGKMKADLRSAETALRQTSTAFRRQRAAVADASGALKTFGANSREAASVQRQVRGEIASTIRSMRDMDQQARRTQQAAMDRKRRADALQSAGAAGVGAYFGVRQLGAPVQKAMTYDQQLTYIASTLADGGDLESKRLAKRQVSGAIDDALRQGGGSRDDAATALNRLVASGAFQDKEALSVLASVSKTSHAAGASSDDVAAMAVAMRNNGVAPGDMMRGFDAAFKAGQLGGVELRDMARWLPQQLALARGSGMTGLGAVEWLASANQVSLSTAGSPDEAANNIVNLLQKLNSRELATTMEKVAGVDWHTYMTNRQREGVAPPQAFAEVLDKQLASNENYQTIKADLAKAKNPEDRRVLLERAAMIAESSEVGQLIADRQALMAAIALRSGQQRQRDIESQLQAADGTVDRESDFVREQGWSKAQDLRNTADRANEQVFDKLSGPLSGLTEQVDAAARAFPGLTAGLYGAGTALAAFAGGGVVGGLVGGMAGGRAASRRTRGGMPSGSARGGISRPSGGASGGAGGLRGLLGRGLLLGVATYLGERAIESGLGAVNDRLYTPEHQAETATKLKTGGIWSPASGSMRDTMAVQTGFHARRKRKFQGNLGSETASWPVAAQQSMQAYVQALSAGGAEAEARAAVIGEQIKAELSVTGNPDVNTAALERALGIARQLSNVIRKELGGGGAAAAPSGDTPVGGARAGGGPVKAGHTYAVGGRGIELFTPDRSGTVIPNSALGGGGNIHVVNNVVVHAGDASNAGQIEAAVRRGVEQAIAVLDQKLNRSTQIAFASTGYGDA